MVGVKSQGALGKLWNQRTPKLAASWVYMWTIGTGWDPQMTVPKSFVPSKSVPCRLLDDLPVALPGPAGGVGRIGRRCLDRVRFEDILAIDDPLSVGGDGGVIILPRQVLSE